MTPPFSSNVLATGLAGTPPPQYNDGGTEDGEIVKIRFVYRWKAFSIMLWTASPNKIDVITSWWCVDRDLRIFCWKLIESFSQAYGVCKILIFDYVNTCHVHENTNRFQNAQIVAMKNYIRYFRGFETNRFTFGRKLCRGGFLLRCVQQAELISLNCFPKFAPKYARSFPFCLKPKCSSIGNCPDTYTSVLLANRFTFLP